MNLKAIVLYPCRCIEQVVAVWPWLEYAVMAGMFLFGLYTSLHMWLVWREARLYYAARRQVWPRLWPEQRVWDSSEL